jgi:FkbM family methyltransferase
MSRTLRRLVVQLGNHVPASAARVFGPTSRASILARPLVNRFVSDRPVVAIVRSGGASGMKMQIEPHHEKFYWTGHYEVEVQRAISEGAHIGFFSLIASRIASTSGQVHAFEPYGPSRDRLLTNLRLNDVENIVVHVEAVAAESGPALFYPARESLEWTLVRELGKGDPIEVQCTTLDEQADILGRPRLIKVDVEGAEIDVLRGASRLFASEQPPDVIVEFTNDGMCAEAASLHPTWAFSRLTQRHWMLRPPPNVHRTSG